MAEERVAGQAVWSAVLTAALDAIIVMDARGIVREFNPAAQATFGWTRAEAVGQTLSNLIVPPELRSRHTQGLAHYLRTGEGPVLNKRIEIEAVRKDGSRLPVELAIVPFLESGERLFAGYLRDLSPRVQAQRELERRNDVARLLQEIPLAASVARDVDEAVGKMLDAVRRFMGWPLGHAYFLEDGRLASHGLWSQADAGQFGPFRAATERTHLGPGEGLPGRVLASGKPVWVPDLASDPNFPRNLLVKDHGLRAGFGFPVLVDGRVQVVLEFFSPRAEQPQPDVLAVLEAVGREVGRVLQRIAQETALREANQRLEALARARQEFLRQAAHELGTPLTPLGVQLAVLRREPLPQEVQRRLDIVARNVERMRSLAADLLDAARIDAGRLRVDPKPMDLAEAARQAVTGHADVAAEAGVSLHAVGAGPVQAHADPQRVAQMLDNLLANALRFTDRGGRVEVTARSEGGRAVLQVRDDGIGIAPEALARLFQPFSQVHDRSERRVGGTGLGLFICRGIADASGGTLEAASAGLGHGASFTLRLPTAGPHAPAASRSD